MTLKKLLESKLTRVCEEFTSKLAAMQNESKQELAKMAAYLADLCDSGDVDTEAKSQGHSRAVVKSAPSESFDIKPGVNSAKTAKDASKTDRSTTLSARVEAALARNRFHPRDDCRQYEDVIDLTADGDNEDESRTDETEKISIMLPPLLVPEQYSAGSQTADEVAKLEKTLSVTRRLLEEQTSETKKMRSWVEELLYAVDKSAADKRGRQATLDCLISENNRLRSHATRLRYEKVQEMNKRSHLLKASQAQVARLSQQIRELEGEATRITRQGETSAGHFVGRVEALSRELQLSNQRVKYLEFAYKQACIDKLNAERVARDDRTLQEVAHVASDDNREFDFHSADVLEITDVVKELDEKDSSGVMDATERRGYMEDAMEYSCDDLERLNDPVENIRKELQKQADQARIARCVVKVNKILPLEMPTLLPKNECLDEETSSC